MLFKTTSPCHQVVVLVNWATVTVTVKQMLQVSVLKSFKNYNSKITQCTMACRVSSTWSGGRGRGGWGGRVRRYIGARAWGDGASDLRTGRRAHRGTAGGHWREIEYSGYNWNNMLLQERYRLTSILLVLHWQSYVSASVLLWVITIPSLLIPDIGSRPCSSQFSTDHLLSVRASCFDLPLSEFDMVVRSQLMAGMDDDTRTTQHNRNRDRDR